MKLPMNEINYQKELDKILSDENNKEKSLVLHSCCGPCSSYVLRYLRTFFNITVFYYNPNITEKDEYQKRVGEQKRLIELLNAKASCEGAFPIKVIEGDYDVNEFFDIARGYEKDKEGGERCSRCFKLRLEKTARLALELNADYFATTLTVSPMKNSKVINTIGFELEKEMALSGPDRELKWLPSDFKKRDGYKQSIELSKKYDLYRQNYCGCIYSKLERDEQIRQKQALES